MTWHAQRFIASPNRAHVSCLACGRSMWLPPSKSALYVTCGAACKKIMQSRSRDERRRECETCGAEFFPRPGQLRMGHGRFCRQACNLASRAALSMPDAKAKSLEGQRLKRLSGTWTILRGPDNPKWAGGLAARRQRLLDSGATRQRTRDYRKRNPEKVREFSARRKGRKLGRLPRGTIQAIGDAQRWKCAICRVGVRQNYHVDHITPLARGGEHAPKNLQLLCPACNVRKSDKDPIAYMQERGFLL